MEAATPMPTRLEDYASFYIDPFVTPPGFEDKTTLQDEDTKGKTSPFLQPLAWAQKPRRPPSSRTMTLSGQSTTRLPPSKRPRKSPTASFSKSCRPPSRTSKPESPRRASAGSSKRKQESARRKRTSPESKEKEPYLPIIITPDEPEPSIVQTKEDEQDLKLLPGFAGNGEGKPAPGLIVLPIQPKKKRRFALANILRKMNEKEAAKPQSPRNIFRFSGNSSKTNVDETSGTAESSTANKLKKTNVVECVLCLEDFSPKDMVKVVCHGYCRECFERLIAAAVQNEQQWPPKCCLNEIPFRTVHRYVSKNLAKTYKERSEEWKIPVSERLYCNQPGCSLWIKADQVNPGLRIARCTAGHWSCTICRGPQHDNADCPQDRDLALTNALAEEEGWQHCSQCQALVEHREACQHMTCRCGHHFCYVCGQRWRTCECTMDQLHAVKTGASGRREERLRREAEAEAELRDALRQIEEFEREEALKAELLRQEQERQEEERRQRELEERVRLESLRRHEIDVKYRELRETLDGLHDLQEVVVRYQHDKEAEISSHEAQMSSAELEAKQLAEQLDISRAAGQRLAAREKALADEYGLRVVEERRTEDAYLMQLEQFFADKDAGEERVEGLMQDFRRKMDDGWRAWGRWRDDELARHRARVEEERTIREELMYSAKRRHEERLEDDKKELARRQAAELRWVALVIQERVRLLDEREAVELDDAESFFSVSESEAGETAAGETTRRKTTTEKTTALRTVATRDTVEWETMPWEITAEEMAEGS